MNYVDDDDKPLKIHCSHCNRYIKISGRSGEILYVNFLHAGMTNIGLYPKYLDTKQFLFQWPGRT